MTRRFKAIARLYWVRETCCKRRTLRAAKLFDILVGPAKQAIAPNSRVIVIPDGSLNGLNFETLLVSEPKLHYWIEDVTVVNASSLRLLAASHNSSNNTAGKLLLIGDAVAPDPEYGELPEAALEID